MSVLENVREQLKIDEGVVFEIYLCPKGLPTFGIGHLIVDGDPEFDQAIGTPVSETRVYEAFEKDFETHVEECRVMFDCFDELPDEVQEIIINMMFNLGRTRFELFKKFKAAIIENDWNEAANQMCDSRWYVQVGNRSKRLVARMREVI